MREGIRGLKKRNRYKRVGRDSRTTICGQVVTAEELVIPKEEKCGACVYPEACKCSETQTLLQLTLEMVGKSSM